jgi:hypothetical protein
VVLGPGTVNSPWVHREVSKALEVEKSRDGYRVIPVLLPGVTARALGCGFRRSRWLFRWRSVRVG